MFTKNIKIVKSSGKLPKPLPSNENVNWAFTDIDFSKLDIVDINSNSNGYSITDSKIKIKPKKLKELMNGRDAILVVYPNKCTHLESKKFDKYFTAETKQRYGQLPCVSLSPNKDALISCAIVPSGLGENSNSNYFDNGLVFPSSTFGTEINGGRQAKYNKNSYNWVPSFKDDGYMRAAQTDKNADKLFGSRQCQSPGAGYIDMSACKNILYDKQDDFTATRIYTLKSNNSSEIKGSCAICYSFIDCDPPKKGKIESPILNISLSDKKKVNSIQFSVGPSGYASARVGSDVAIGDIGGGGNGNGVSQPPQASAIGGNTVYMYPLYNGFVFTGNVGQGGMFVKYSEFETYYNMIEIKGGSPTKEIQTDWKRNPYSQMQWFPTLVQEGDLPTNFQLNLMKKMPVEITNGQVITGNTIELKKLNFQQPQMEWLCSTGRFAYCPLKFVPQIKFDLYFKGQFQSNTSNPDFEYFVYPIGATANVKDGDMAEYDNFTKDGAKCITNVTLMSKEDVSNCNQAIYKVSFDYEYSDDELPPVPLEMFGCVIATKYKKPRMQLANQNGNFHEHEELKNIKFHNEFNILQYANPFNNWMDFITNVNISSQFQGPTGSFTLDEYAMNRSLSDVKLQQCVGELDLDIMEIAEAGGGLSSRFNGNNIFKGYALELRNQVSQGGHVIQGSLQGVQKKLQDMKLICAPYWDGDRLEMICRYFELYCNVRIYMINFACGNYSNKQGISLDFQSWKANKSRIIGDVKEPVQAPDFRVPRSFEYSKPSVDFPTSTTCLQALNRLAEFTSCTMVIQPNGDITFFELNDMGVPYYVENQKNIVKFGPQDVISLNLSPYLENKYNSFITFGLLKKRSKKTNRVEAVSVKPGLQATFAFDKKASVFPWARPNVAVENGSLTPSELKYVHANNVLFGIADTYQGQTTVYGNTLVNHLYQRVDICDMPFFVTSIDHQIDLTTKNWTTSYGLTYFDGKGPKYDVGNNSIDWTK